jgi:uncharacterized protein with GYD domain
MTTYISLSNFTDQGIRNVRDTTKRADAVRELAKKFGATMKDIYWTLGSMTWSSCSRPRTTPP